MPDQPWTLVRLTEQETQRSGAVLAQAFFADPLFAYMLPDTEARSRALPWCFTTFLRYGCRFGEAWAIVDDLRGDVLAAAWWMSLPEADFSPERLDAIGFGDASTVLDDAAVTRLLVANGALDDAHHRAMPPPCLYLPLIGVAPDHQGRGVGAHLVQRFLAAADAAHRPACLGTFTPSNVPFYERQGFAVLADGVDPASELHYWILGRERVDASS